MKRFLAVVLIIATMILVGCGSGKSVDTSSKSNEEVAAVLQKDSLWVMDSDNMPYLNDAIKRKDVDYLKQLMIEGKVFLADKDTKVTRFGVTADKNNVLILFNEGRYTNKTGCTHASNVVDEKDFPAYVENQKKKKFTLIQDGLTKTEKYSEIVASGNLQEITQFRNICLDCTNAIKKLRQEQDIELIKAAEMAIDILIARDNSLFSYESFMEYSEKAEQESSSSKKRRVYESMREKFMSDVDKYQQKAEKLRHEFRDKYGF